MQRTNKGLLCKEAKCPPAPPPLKNTMMLSATKSTEPMWKDTSHTHIYHAHPDMNYETEILFMGRHRTQYFRTLGPYA